MTSLSQGCLPPSLPLPRAGGVAAPWALAPARPRPDGGCGGVW